MKTEIQMYKKRETKGTIVYDSVDSKALIKTLYLMKNELPDSPPSKITVTVQGE